MGSIVRGVQCQTRANITNVADRNNTVSIGSDDNQRQIMNVAAGTEDTDAVKKYYQLSEHCE